MPNYSTLFHTTVEMKFFSGSKVGHGEEILGNKFEQVSTSIIYNMCC